MSEPDYQMYLQQLGIQMTVSALLTSFVFTALTLVLMEFEDITSLTSQATLLVLLVTLILSEFTLAVTQIRYSLITLHALGHSIDRLPSTPGYRFGNLLGQTSIFLMGVSIVLMFFARNLIYLGLASIVLLGLSELVFLVYIVTPFLKQIRRKSRQV